MATNDALSHFLTRTEPVEDSQRLFAPGDTSRMSVEAMVAAKAGTARELSSEGDLRLRGMNSSDTSVELMDLGRIVSSWQKLVSAVGGALVDVRTLRGQLSVDIVMRTSLLLSASPTAGSVVLHIRPKANPFDEVAPQGNMPILGETRPLVDRASEALIELLAAAVSTRADSTDGLSDRMRELGPRVGSALLSFAESLTKSDITLDAIWREPAKPTRMAQISPSAASWIHHFVSGRDLDAEVSDMSGILRTISDADRWLVEVDDQPLRMNARSLESAMIARFHVGQHVNLRVQTVVREQPDGTVHQTHQILHVADPEEA